jgi:sugar lactone lactonase YvrE
MVKDFVSNRALLAGALACLPAAMGVPIAAQELEGVLYVCDSSDDRVMWLTDLDLSGAAQTEVPGEVGLFYDDASPGPDLSTPDHLVIGEDGAIYLLDGGTVDAVLKLEDKNRDGDANDDGEATIFYDASAGGPRLYTPNGMARAPDGSFYIADDGSAGRRILRLRDGNADGDALDPDEASIVYDATALATPVIGDPESLAIAPGGGIYVGDATLQAVFILEDATGDGDFLEEGESRVFFQAATEDPLADVESIIAADGGLYVADKATGKVVFLKDSDGNGQVSVPGEVSVFLDATASPRVAGITDFIRIGPGRFIVLDNTKDGVFVISDLNADGDVLDESEVVRWLLDDGSTFATPHGLALGPRRSEPPVETRFLRSDATGDGRLDISDPIATLGYLFLGSAVSGCLDAIDSDDSGTATISDAILALNYLFTGGPAPPPPFPEPGPDPTEDSVRC